MCVCELTFEGMGLFGVNSIKPNEPVDRISINYHNNYIQIILLK